MSKLQRGMAAEYDEMRWGGGLFSSVLPFILFLWQLGHHGLFR